MGSGGLLGLDGHLQGFCGICGGLGVDGFDLIGVGGILACGRMDQLGILCGDGFQKLAELIVNIDRLYLGRIRPCNKPNAGSQCSPYESLYQECSEP